MTNGFHHDSEMTEKDQSQLQDEESVAESVTCVAEEPAELNDSASEIEFDAQTLIRGVCCSLKRRQHRPFPSTWFGDADGNNRAGPRHDCQLPLKLVRI